RTTRRRGVPAASDTRSGTLIARPWRRSTSRSEQRSEQRTRTARPRLASLAAGTRRRARTHTRGATASPADPDGPVEDPPLPEPEPKPPPGGGPAGSPPGMLATARSERSTFRRPPLTLLPANAGDRSTPPMIAAAMSCGCELGAADHISAAAPDTCGAAIDVPLAQL